MEFLSEMVKSIETKANLDLSVFREPRGVSRVLQLIFGFLACLALYGFEGVIRITYTCTTEQAIEILYSYPFELSQIRETITCNTVPVQFRVVMNDTFSQYAVFFLYICGLSIIYCFISMIVYSKCTATYETNNRFPLADFVATVLIAVLWLFASATWAHGLSGLKGNTNADLILTNLRTQQAGTLTFNKVTTSTYFGLNVSAMLGCLCFFLWATDLWFLYKETPWFQGRRGGSVGSPA